MITTTLTAGVISFLLAILTERKSNVSNVLITICIVCVVITAIGVMTL